MRRALVGVVALAVAFALYALGRGDSGSTGSARGHSPTTTSTPARRSTTTAGHEPATTTSTTVAVTRPGVPAASVTLVKKTVIGGPISPKSVAASGHGLVFAENMMYKHTVTVYGADGTLRTTIPDGVDLSQFGVSGHPGISKGAPVEAAFTNDGRYAYVSNYSMHGSGWGPEGTDTCTPASGYDASYLYRIDTTTMKIDQLIAVGVVPKFVAVTPDQRDVLVTNWCSFDLSVVDRATAREIKRIPMGRHPRGIAVAPDSSVAYVAIMGGTQIAVVDLHTFAVSWINGVGSGPRTIVLSPDGKTLYATLNAQGDVAKVDTATRRVVARVRTGNQPRSMAISTDGTALYVVNYESSTVTVLRTSDLSVVQTFPTFHHPIGITYEPTTGSVWVACYVGKIIVFSPASG